MAKKKILFISEDITLAQVVRLVQLAKSLDDREYDIYFAASEFKGIIFTGTSFRLLKLNNIGQQKAQKALDKGMPVYTEKILKKYVSDEIALIEQVKPDFIVGDFRLSLAVSATLFQIPLAVLINAYWSPYTYLREYPIPDHPMVNILGVRRANFYFNLARPFAFNLFAKPVNNLRKQYGLSSVGSLLEVLTFGDYTLYPDTPGLIPTKKLPSRHVFLGPVLWSPPGKLDVPFEKANGRPIVYLTMGSSGKVEVLPKIIEVLASMPVFVLFSSAGRMKINETPDNFYSQDFIPGNIAAAVSNLVICNGGSTTGYQALNEGTPVIGVPSNLDQYLAMNYIAASGAGKVIRAGKFSPREFEKAVWEILENPGYKSNALKVQKDFAKYNYQTVFQELVRNEVAPKAVEIK